MKKKESITKEQSVWGIYNGRVKVLRNQGLTLQALLKGKTVGDIVEDALRKLKEE